MYRFCTEYVLVVLRSTNIMYRLLNEVSVSFSGVIADCHFPVQKMPCFTVRMNIQTKRLNPVKAGRVPVYRHYAGTHRGYNGSDPA